ncbi:hypothetical protein F2Q69_00003681 [Brassica cretica]|uniref:Uncharacterized protein n=1 Tax=Brassica cretica TaxID=69181 RepID=A0A8S9NYR0_BRACR|nr:hypothetical protein F2Q69_00003681 [Brassica cretica]
MRTERSPPRRNEITEVSPQYSHRRVVSNRGHLNQGTRSPVEQQWRAKAQHTERNEGKERAADEHRLPLERNLDKEDFPPLQFAQVPPTRTTEEVMEELREVTYQYTNCADPVESAARKQRVLDGEVHGLMEQTASTIVAREQEAQQAYITTRVAETEVENEMETEQSATLPLVLPQPPQNSKRKGRPPKAKQREIRISPKIFKGSNSRKRNWTAAMASPAN